MVVAFALATCATVRAQNVLHQAAGVNGNWSAASSWSAGGAPGVSPGDVAAGPTAAGTFTFTLDINSTIGSLYVSAQGATQNNWTIASDSVHVLTLDGTGMTTANNPGGSYAAGEAIIASRGNGVMTVNPNIVMATNLDIGGTSPQPQSAVNINGNITASNAGTLTFRGIGATGQSNLTSVITVNGNIGASGSNIAVTNLRTANAGTTAGSVVINGNLGSSVTTLTQNSVATMTLTSTNTYTGTTTITSGTLQIRNGTAVPDASAVNMGGGTLSVAATSKEGSGATVSGGATTGTNTVGLGALTLTVNAAVDFDSASNGNLLAFAGGSNLGASTLAVTNWTNTAFNGTTSSGSTADDRLIFGQDMSASLGLFNFNGNGAGVGVREISLGGGFFEVGFVAVPEPATWVAGLSLFMVAATRIRRRARDARAV